jgi:hypothetical protein
MISVIFGQPMSATIVVILNAADSHTTRALHGMIPAKDLY